MEEIINTFDDLIKKHKEHLKSIERVDICSDQIIVDYKELCEKQEEQINLLKKLNENNQKQIRLLEDELKIANQWIENSIEHNY
jgi:hypothetical protein